MHSFAVLKIMAGSEFGSPLKRFKLVFLGEQSGECLVGNAATSELVANTREGSRSDCNVGVPL